MSKSTFRGGAMSDNQITLLIFSIFIFAPFISVALEHLQDKAKAKIDEKLAPHGLRLKRRG